MKSIHVYKAQPVGASTPEAVTILIKDELPSTLNADSRQVMDVDASRLAQALWDALPGGTLDRLCAALLYRQASRLHVARTQPGGEL